MWDAVREPRKLIRHLGQHELLTVIRDEGAVWLPVRLSDGTEGFVRRDTLRDYVGGPAPAMGAPAQGDQWAALSYAPVRQPGGIPSFPGALRVSTGLTVFAWISLVLSQIMGIGAAADYSCGNPFGSSCGDETATKIFIYVGLAVSGLFMALLTWAAAYNPGCSLSRRRPRTESVQRTPPRDFDRSPLL